MGLDRRFFLLNLFFCHEVFGKQKDRNALMYTTGDCSLRHTRKEALGSDTLRCWSDRSGRYGYSDVRLTIRRTDKSVFRSTDTIVRKIDDDNSSGERDLPLKVRPDPWQ
jgi:hypothetical protein